MNTLQAQISDFETIAYAKTILAGEYAVLENYSAVIFPVKSKALSLQYQQTDMPLTIQVLGDNAEVFKKIFWLALARALMITKQDVAKLKGSLNFHNTIPIGNGLGASGALCTTIGKWFVYLNLIPTSEIFEFAKALENIFHGQSSGADIAIRIAEEPIEFSVTKGYTVIDRTWQPKLFLSHSGKSGITSQCMEKVNRLRQSTPTFIDAVMQDMGRATQRVIQALQSSEKIRLTLLADAMQLACDCFEKLGLAEGLVIDSILHLRQAGALAAKPTGSGDGGYILSLWESSPPSELLAQMILV